MKLILTQPEIEQIVRDHVLATVQLRNGADLQIEFSATRGEAGITATIDIPYMGVTSLPDVIQKSEAAAAVTVTEDAVKTVAASIPAGGTTRKRATTTVAGPTPTPPQPVTEDVDTQDAAAPFAEPEAEASAAEAEAPTEPAPPRKSLFG